jgi:hypothetical protein
MEVLVLRLEGRAAMELCLYVWEDSLFLVDIFLPLQQSQRMEA